VLLAQARYESGGVPMASVIRYSPPLSRSFRVCADTIIIRLLPDAVESGIVPVHVATQRVVNELRCGDVGVVVDVREADVDAGSSGGQHRCADD
jgi:hypothetical protein